LNPTGDAGWIPRLAQTWTWSRDSMSIAFHLNPRARWHDGQPVRAADVKFSLALFKDPAVKSIVASDLDNVDSATVADSLTAIVWYKRRSPEQFFQVAYNLAITPEHLLKTVDRATLAASDFAKHPVGSGPFRFVQWTPRQTVELVADTTYYLGRPKLDRLIWSWNPDPAAAAAKVVSGDADFLELTMLETMAQATTASFVRSLPYRSLSYGSLVFNLRDPKNRARPNPIFGDRGVRLALSLALDRDAMRKNIFDSLAVVALGPFTRYLAVADTTVPQVPYDTIAAARMLDSLGWRDTNGDGVRERNGVPLHFSLLVPTQSGIRRRYAVLIQEQLRRVGAKMDIDVLDIGVLQPRMFAGQFDMFLNSWQVDPAPSEIRQAWHTGPTDGGNFGGYSNPRFDAVLDSAASEFAPAKVKALYSRAYRIIDGDMPGVWLYEVRSHALIHRRVHPVVDGSDLWWRDLRLWSIPAGERIPRDKIGVVTKPSADGP
jgi:peptide/nickel transport system substrate-binding protein